MSLAERFEAATNAVTPIDEWVDQHPDRDTIIAFAANNALPTARFHQILRDEGCRVGKDGITSFRKRHGYAR